MGATGPPGWRHGFSYWYRCPAQCGGTGPQGDTVYSMNANQDFEPTTPVRPSLLILPTEVDQKHWIKTSLQVKLKPVVRILHGWGGWGGGVGRWNCKPCECRRHKAQF